MNPREISADDSLDNRWPLHVGAPARPKAYYDGAVTVCGRRRAADHGNDLDRDAVLDHRHAAGLTCSEKIRGRGRRGRDPPKDRYLRRPRPGMPLCPGLRCRGLERVSIFRRGKAGHESGSCGAGATVRFFRSKRPAGHTFASFSLAVAHIFSIKIKALTTKALTRPCPRIMPLKICLKTQIVT